MQEKIFQLCYDVTEGADSDNKWKSWTVESKNFTCFLKDMKNLGGGRHEYEPLLVHTIDGGSLPNDRSLNVT